MLERIREGSQSPWAMIIIGLVVLSFVFAGVGSYLSSSGGTAVATVNGDEIGQNELERAYQSQRAQMESQYGEDIAAMFADENYLKQFRSNVLQSLINNKLVEQKAEEMGLRVGDDQIRQTIKDMQGFQTAGQFDNERYLAVLRQNGFSPAQFRDYLRVELTREQLTRALQASSFALDGETQRAWQLQSQIRGGRYFIVDAKNFADSVTISDEDINNFYEQNIAAFDTQEKVNIAYVTLSVDDVMKDVDVSDEEVETFYEDNKDQYHTEEERRVSHILIEVGEDKEAAEQQAEKLRQSIEDGADFAEVAKQSSADTFSAENGGDLDYITRDMMEPAFEEAAFNLEEGEVSDVVETEFGYHIIKLTDIKPEQVTELADVEEKVRETLLNDKAMERFYELRSRMDEVAFEMPETLDDVAGIANQPVEETGLFTRSDAPEVMSNPAVLNAAFSAEQIEDRMNSEVIELDNETVMVLRVKAHEPQRTRELAEVKAQIERQLQAERLQEAAAAWAQDAVAKLNAGEDISSMLEQYGLSWQDAESVSRGQSELPRNLVQTLFSLSEQEGEKAGSAKLASGNVGVIELQSIQQAEAPDEELASTIRQRLGAAYGQSTYQSFINGLRENAEIEVLTQ
ncbi:peptidylprolyl isomerase [Salinimonas sp. HHU 13199]|uniref:Periplasmic chaperone PpiD n=1 Tax=Salinimonas profundi TaxID=2729140 RepID=A0ABR8LM53_9ALTE|nr:SurA N-terminal domain-containing protein [Salinimonas profundi]MBD3587282.1 peptidylprolyl isomerase [Salinimonas profundi]